MIAICTIHPFEPLSVSEGCLKWTIRMVQEISLFQEKCSLMYCLEDKVVDMVAHRQNPISFT